jgi:hypothetical protein
MLSVGRLEELCEYGEVEGILMYFLYVGVRKQCMLGFYLSHIEIFFSLDQSNVSLTYLKKGHKLTSPLETDSRPTAECRSHVQI